MKKHWYLVGYSYNYHGNTENGIGNGSFDISYDEVDGLIGRNSLDFLAGEAKRIVQNENDYLVKKCFVLSISYLGHMTDEEFKEN